MYEKMIKSLVPSNLKAQLKEQGTLEQGIMFTALSSLTVAVLTAVLMILSTGVSILKNIPLVQNQQFLVDLGIVGAAGGITIIDAILTIIIQPIIALVVAFILTGIMYLIAKAFGGTGTFGNQFYHFAVATGGLTIMSALVSLIPILGELGALLLSVYFLYPMFLIYRAVHKLSDMKSIILTIGPLVVLFILGIIAVFVVVMLFGATMAAVLGMMS
jgi:hypothetical protein